MAKKSEVVVLPASESVKRLSADDLKIIAEAWENAEGSIEILESAIGAWLVGRLAGGDALRVVHSWRTLRNYERVLGRKFAELPPRTEESLRVNGIRYAEKFKAFWRALSAGVSSEPRAREVVRE